jgi:LacI family transcriptional regulator
MRKKTGVNIRDIAEELNLNISTVSRALNKSFLISKETTELVIRKAREMGYKSEVIKKNIIILLPPSNTQLDIYSLNLINALKNKLAITDYYWEFINDDKIDIIYERSVAGIISIDYSHYAAWDITTKYNLPLVCINNHSQHSNNVYSVNSDDESAIIEAFNCLYEHGHKNIAFLCSSNFSYIDNVRISTFEKTIEKYNLKDKSKVIISSAKNIHGTILDLYHQGITGIISDGESSGLKIWNSLNYCNIEIPEQMSLVTWEMPYVSSMVKPALTTVAQNFDLIAEKAIYLMDCQLNNISVTTDVIIPYVLNMRDTVSLPRNL